MQKPNNYEETKVGGGDFTPVDLGGHKAIIKKAEETTSSTGKPMLKVAIDFDKDDVQPNYFTDLFNNDTREDKKWNNNGMLYIVSEDANGACTKSFKSFLTSVKNSNPGWEEVWGKDFGVQLKGKKIGVVYGEVENEYEGKVTMQHRYRWCCDYAKATEQKVPAPQYLNGSSPAVQPTAPTSDGFLDAGDVSDSEIPF